MNRGESDKSIKVDSIQSTADSDQQNMARFLLFEFMRTSGKKENGAPTLEQNARHIPDEQLYFCVERHEPDIELINKIISNNPEALKTPRDRGWLPLHHAAMASSFKGVQLLLEMYPDAAKVPQEDGFLPLHMSVYFEETDIEVVELLLAAYPAAAKCKSKDGRTPLAVALENSALNPEVIRTLLRAYPEATSVPTNTGKIPLHLCIINKHCTFKVFEMILNEFQGGACIKDSAPRGRLALHYAVIEAFSHLGKKNETVQIIETLIGWSIC